MFDNVGKKIKGVAKIFCWIGIIGSFIFPLTVILRLINDYYGSKEEKLISLAISIAVLIIGPLLAWLGSLTLYGFGELIDKTDSIDSKLTPKDE